MAEMTKMPVSYHLVLSEEEFLAVREAMGGCSRMQFESEKQFDLNLKLYAQIVDLTERN